MDGTQPPPDADGEWLARVEGGLDGRFRQRRGASRQGTDWAVSLKRGTETRRIIVRAYLGRGVAEATKRDRLYQTDTVVGYVFDRLAQGWSPDQGALPSITILDPPPDYVPVPVPPPQPGFLGRLLDAIWRRRPA